MNTLAELLSSRVKAEIFRLLFVTHGKEIHVRELARRSGLADATVRQELRRLSRLEIVGVRPSGNRTYFHANVDHPLYPDIRSLVLKTSGLVEVLRAALTDPRMKIVFVFGSIAAGTETASSDVDLMVIGTIGMRDLVGFLGPATTALGREVNPHILTPEEFARRRAAGDHFVATILGSARLFVMGSEDELGRLGGERVAQAARDESPGGRRAPRDRRKRPR